MAKNSKGEVIQAMPIDSSTFQGVASNQHPGGGTVMMLDYGNITFHFKNGDKTITGVDKGANFQADVDCTGITSTVAILLT